MRPEVACTSNRIGCGLWVLRDPIIALSSADVERTHS